MFVFLAAAKFRNVSRQDFDAGHMLSISHQPNAALTCRYPYQKITKTPITPQKTKTDHSEKKQAQQPDIQLLGLKKSTFSAPNIDLKSQTGDCFWQNVH